MRKFTTERVQFNLGKNKQKEKLKRFVEKNIVKTLERKEEISGQAHLSKVGIGTRDPATVKMLSFSFFSSVFLSTWFYCISLCL